MREKKGLFYAFAAIAIIVIIGVVIIKAGRQIPAPPEKPKATKTPLPPVDETTPPPKPHPPAPIKPVKEKAVPPEKSPEKDAGLTISGKVTLSDGSPATQAKISLSKIEIGESLFDQKPVSYTTTDKNGNYTITVKNFPVVFIKASHPGYASLTSVAGSATSRKGVSTTGKKQDVVINFTLPPASYIKGCVVDENDKHLRDVSVTFLFRDKQNENFSLEDTFTDNQGRFDIQNIPPGKIMLGAAPLNYNPISKNVTAPADDIILKLTPATASLSGRVFHKTTGEPITSSTVSLVYSRERQGIMMHLPENKSLTDSTGFFSFEHLSPGRYFIKAEKQGLFMLATGEHQYDLLKLEENEKKQGIKIYLYEGHTIKGYITDQTTGEPIEGVKLQTAWGSSKPSEDITDVQGSYMLTGLSGNTVGISVEKENYFLSQKDRDIFHSGIILNPEHFELTKNIQMIPGLFISGRVETEKGAPATNAQVFLYHMDNRSSRDKAHPVDQLGAFKLSVAPFVPCLIKAQAPGFPSSFSDTIDVQDKSVENIVITMKKAGSVSGSVQDENNKPVENARVWVLIPMAFGNIFSYENFSDLAILSDSIGQFKIENLPSGEIVLYAEKENYAKSKRQRVSIDPGDEKTGVILQLANSAFLSGTITDPDGNPIKDVRVNAYCSSSETNSQGFTKTDAHGFYRIEGLYNTPHNVQLSHTDFGDDFHQNIEVGRDDADFVMGADNITLIGNVKDWKTGSPIQNFSVTASDMKPEKDPDCPGRFLIRNLKPNHSFPLKIEANGYLPSNLRKFTLPRGENPVEKTFLLGPGGSIKGRMVNKATKEPLEQVTVQLFTFSGVNEFDVAYSGNQWQVSRGEPTKIQTTTENGLFHFETLPAESCFIRFIPPEPFKPKQGNVTVKHGEITDMGDVEIGSGGNIRGKLVQMPDEIPVPGKTITLTRFGVYTSHQNALTDEKGDFEFLSLVSGKYFIMESVSKNSKSVEVTDDETQECILRIGTGTLKGIVLKKGKPQDVQVNIRHFSQGMTRGARTDSEGAFEITGLVPGKWKATFYMGGYSSSADELVDISQDQITEKIFELPSGRIVGKVVNEEDEPVQGALVSARLMQVADAEDAYYPKKWSAQTGREGAFVIADLPSASYAVSASKKDFEIAMIENVMVPENDDSAPVLLRLEKGKGGTLVSVALNVKDAKPVPGAWCYLTTAQGVRIDHGKQRGEDGVITIPNIPSGSYLVQVSSYGFSVHEHMVEIKDGETVELEDVMYEAGVLQWTVLDAEGNPVANAPCRIEPTDAGSIEKPREGRTDAQGLWIQRGLYPGAYRVTTQLEDGRQASDIIEIQAHEYTRKSVVVE